MNYIQYEPPVELKNYVRYFWSFESTKHSVRSLEIRSFADKFPRLIFQDLKGYQPLRSLQGELLPTCYLSGLDTRHTVATMGGAFSHFGVSFYPHALAAFFEIDSVDLVNTMPDIQLICKTEIGQQLDEAPTNHHRIRILTKYLYNRLHVSRQRDLLIDHFLHQGNFAESLYYACQEYKISERQMQRRFKNSVGISYKKFQRILRFEKSLSLLATAQYTELASIAYELDYTDQAHFIKDFEEFSGMSPYAFVKRKSVGAESSSFIYTED